MVEQANSGETPVKGSGVEVTSSPEAANSGAEVKADAPETTTTPAVEASTDGEKKTLLNAVLEAVKPKEQEQETKVDEDAADLEEVTSESKPDLGDDERDVREITEAEFENTRKFSARRVKQLYRRLKQAEPLAESARALNGVLSEHRISSEEFSEVISAMTALKRGEFQRFLDLVGPRVRMAQEATGFVLPPDLAAAVDEGHMTTQAARHYAQERMQGFIAQQRLHDERLSQEQYRREQIAGSMRDAVNDWADTVAKTDPDFASKAPLVAEVSKGLMFDRERAGVPVQSPAEALEIAQEAYRRVNAARGTPRVSQPANPAAAKPKATSPVPTSTHAASGARPKPRSLMDAAMQGLEASRART